MQHFRPDDETQRKLDILSELRPNVPVSYWCNSMLECFPTKRRTQCIILHVFAITVTEPTGVPCSICGPGCSGKCLEVNVPKVSHMSTMEDARNWLKLIDGNASVEQALSQLLPSAPDSGKAVVKSSGMKTSSTSSGRKPLFCHGAEQR
ncbi:hypothetical protein WJX73_010534 [Symbiochloris irregularis]|uniref:Uncharacterized protein n=1 Tax=Symbiochloris irregularis TaxID=706552 RepID=A0AAW1NS90_9CHLO